MKMIRRRRINVVHVSLVFFLLYTCEQTVGCLQKLIQKSISEENADYNFDGYIASATIYLSYALLIPVTPMLVSILGCRLCIFVGALTSASYSLVLIVTKEWVTYVILIVAGFGESMLWVAENNYIVQNAHEYTLMSDIGLFWGIYNLCFFPGCIFSAIEFQGITDIDVQTRTHLLYFLIGFAIVAALFATCLGKPQGSLSHHNERLGPMATAKKVFSIAKNRNMGVLIIAIAHNGLQQVFGMFIYPPSVAFTKRFGTVSTQLAPISTLCYAIGTCLSGFLSMWLSRKKTIKYWYTFCFGSITLLIAYIGIFINLPDGSAFGPTFDSSYLPPNMWLALVCSLCLGLGEGFHTTQIYTAIGELYPDNSTECGACYEFSKALAGAALLFASVWIGIDAQLLVLLLTGLLSTAGFIWVNRQMKDN